MKRGRPSMREHFREEILNILADGECPLTVSCVKRFLGARRSRPCGWHTVRRYLDELAAERLVLRQVLPTEEGRNPLVVYHGRRSQTGSKREFL